MASYAKEFYKKNHFICRKLNIVLVSSSSKILKGMDEKLILSSEKKLNSLGVKIVTNRKVVEVSSSYVTLSNGERLPVDFMIYTGGIEPNSLVFKLDLDKNSRGYIETNKYLQTEKYSEVYAIGDCTTIYSKDKSTIPKTADTAEQMGNLCAINIQNSIDKKALKEHNIRSRGVLIALGKKYATAKISSFYLSGYFAYIIKKIVEKSYFKKLNYISKRGCKKIFD
jgi:NADH dehydrogenase